MTWPPTNISANRYLNTYFKDFVDLSGQMNVRNGDISIIDGSFNIDGVIIRSADSKIVVEDISVNDTLSVSTMSVGFNLSVSGDIIAEGNLGVGELIANTGLSVVSDQPTQLLVKPNSTTAVDTSIDFRGAINTTNTESSSLTFSNYDSYATNVHTLGKIAGIVRDNTNNTGDLHIQTSSDGTTLQNTLCLMSTGNVGIGKDNPASTLDVNGTLTVSQGIVGSISTISQPNITSVGTLSDLSINGNLDISASDATVTINRDYVGTGSEHTSLFIGNEALVNSSFSHGRPIQSIGWYDSASDISHNWGFGQAGTSNIGTNHDVSGHIGTFGIGPANGGTFGWSPKIFFTEDGNLGIGERNPVHKLQVNGTSMFVGTDIAGEIQFPGGTISSTTTAELKLATDALPIVFSQTDGERMRVHSDGNVGIGTNAPGQKLEVNGNIYINNGLSGSNQGGKLIFDNTNSTHGPNKILLHTAYGFGVLSNTLGYFSNSDHAWYHTSTDATNGTLGMTLNKASLGIGTVPAAGYALNVLGSATISDGVTVGGDMAVSGITFNDTGYNASNKIYYNALKGSSLPTDWISTASDGELLFPNSEYIRLTGQRTLYSPVLDLSNYAFYTDGAFENDYGFKSSRVLVKLMARSRSLDIDDEIVQIQIVKASDSSVLDTIYQENNSDDNDASIFTPIVCDITPYITHAIGDIRICMKIAATENGTADYFDFNHFAVCMDDGSSWYKNSVYKQQILGGLSVGQNYTGQSLNTNNLIVEGNVGVGTTNPKNGMQIVKSNGLTISPNNTLVSTLRLGEPTATNNDAFCSKITSTHVSGTGTADLRLYTSASMASSSTERMVIKSDGKIGIGIENPITNLDVLNNMRIHNTSDGDATLEFMRGTNNTFGGDTSPDYKIQSVNGELSFYVAASDITNVHVMELSRYGQVAIGGSVTSSTSGPKLQVIGDASINSHLTVGGDLTVDGNVNFGGEFIRTDTVVTFTEAIDVSNAGTDAALRVRQVSEGSTVNTYPVAEFYNDNLLAMSVRGDAEHVGDVSMNYRLDVGGDVSMYSRLDVDGDASFNGAVTFGGPLVANALTIAGLNLDTIKLSPASTTDYTISIGKNAGVTNQGTDGVAIGTGAGNTNQNNNSIAIGNNAGYTTQATNSIALGNQAGLTNQGATSIAIGMLAGETGQSANTIVLNATGIALNTVGTDGLYIKPVAESDVTTVAGTAVSGFDHAHHLNYNTGSGEITYGRDVDVSNGSVNIYDGSLNIWGNSASDLYFTAPMYFNATETGGIRPMGAIAGYAAAGPEGISTTMGGGIKFRVKPANSTYDDILSDAMVINSSGHVGVGITDPSAALHIYSHDTASDSHNSAIKILTNRKFNDISGSSWPVMEFQNLSHSEDDNWLGLTAVGNQPFTQTSINMINYNETYSGQYGINTRVKTGLGFSVRDETTLHENALVISNLGRVGIGTIVPEYKLQVRTATSIISNFYRTDATGFGASNAGFITMGNNTLANASAIGGSASETNGHMHLSTKRSGTMTEAMTIDYNGRVGIGSTTPGTNSNNNILLDICGGGVVIQNPGANSGVLNYFSNYLTLIYASEAQYNIGLHGSGSKKLTFAVNNAAAAMTIDSTKNVEMMAALTVQSNSSFNNNLSVVGSLNVGNASDTGGVSEKLVVDGHIRVPSGNSIYIGNNMSGNGHLRLHHTAETTYAGSYIDYDSTKSLKIRTTSETTVMTLNSSANVGIGTDAPTEKLHIVGNAYIDGNVETTGNMTMKSATSGGSPTLDFLRGSNWADTPSTTNYRIQSTVGKLNFQYRSGSTTTNNALILNLGNVTIPKTLTVTTALALGTMTINNTGTIETSTGNNIILAPRGTGSTGTVLVKGELSVSSNAYMLDNLDVTGNVALSANLLVSGTTTMSGNVGIGTNSHASHALDVLGTARVTGQYLQVDGTDANEGGQIQIGTGSSYTGQWYMDAYQDTLRLRHNDFANAIVINETNGTVGIGRVPGANSALDVNGDIRIDNGQTANGTQGGKLLFDSAFGVAGPNKIDLHNNGGQYGFGVETNTLKYLSNQNHQFYHGSSSSSDGTMSLDIQSGLVVVPGTFAVGKANASNALDYTFELSGNALFGGSFVAPTANAFGITSANTLLTLGGNYNVLPNSDANTTCKLYISSGDNDSGVGAHYPIYIEDENGYDSFFIKNSNTGGGEAHIIYLASNVGIGSTNPGQALDVVGNIAATGTITSSSDAKLKENVKSLDNALDKINAMRGVSYTRNDLLDKDAVHIGLIAQEVEEIYPEIVTDNAESGKSVAYGNMVAPLIEAIKILTQRLECLESDNVALKSRLDVLEQA